MSGTQMLQKKTIEATAVRPNSPIKVPRTPISTGLLDPSKLKRHMDTVNVAMDHKRQTTGRDRLRASN